MNQKQTMERARQEMAKKYKGRIESLEKELREQKALNAALQEDNSHLSSRVSELEEWVERMQEFCNMTDEERNSAIAKADTMDRLLKLSMPFMQSLRRMSSIL